MCLMESVFIIFSFHLSSVSALSSNKKEEESAVSSGGSSGEKLFLEIVLPRRINVTNLIPNLEKTSKAQFWY